MNPNIVKYCFTVLEMNIKIVFFKCEIFFDKNNEIVKNYCFYIYIRVNY